MGARSPAAQPEGMSRALAFLLTILAFGAQAQTYQARQSIEFSIRIPVVAKLQLVDHPATLEAKGEEVVVRGAALEIVTNARGGAAVRVQAIDPELEHVEVEGLPERLPSGRLWLKVTYRMKFAPGASTAARPWPIRLALQAP